ncbi:phytanoyl-CoA dioxygenase family protein [Kineosporia rhizophila]|uniref:phytanoyl-CoA dioxygenase family protein n=1 Tax=Kineosporia rhizophila TaxID=84633 RepID=UPI001E322092|nr:phytanoyl-CoA dioxygenase family protein [Kineosporia rhizophila]
MDDALIEQFSRDGYLKLEGAVPAEVAAECAGLLWKRIGLSPDEPAGWTEPVHWVDGMGGPAFEAAANAPALVDAFDTLVGPGRWVRRSGMGSFPLRFPHPVEPDDAGWHIEASYPSPDGSQYLTNYRSRARALLLLFLFSEVSTADAPTRVRVGSHRDVPKVLRPYGEAGESIFTFAAEVDRASAHRPVALATGSPGDVFVCHPFLVHAAQPHHGRTPRFMAQPGMDRAVETDLGDEKLYPVDQLIRDFL